MELNYVAKFALASLLALAIVFLIRMQFRDERERFSRLSQGISDYFAERQKCVMVPRKTLECLISTAEEYRGCLADSAIDCGVDGEMEEARRITEFAKVIGENIREAREALQ